MKTRGTILVLALLLAGCLKVVTIDSPASPRSPGGSGHLRAGFARVDITPPPGPGLFGYGTEGARSRGHRMRLYARALALEDPAGERFAFVLADLGAVSALLHRKIAERIYQRTGIGADRLILSATHTHSAPGHFFGAPAYDEQASTVEGFDPAFADVLADGMARAVTQAFERMDSARAAWGQVAVWGQTRVRNDTAMQRNRPRFRHPGAATAPAPNENRYRLIDPQLNMLRIDTRVAGRYQPAGSLIIFPVHGTLNPGANELLDGDLHSIVMQGLERRIAPGALLPDSLPNTIHLFANGAEGDIVANFSQLSRCPAPTPRQIFVPTGPRRPPPPDNFQPVLHPPFPECLQAGRAEALTIGKALTDAAIALHQQLGGALQQEAAGQLRIARAFDVLSASVKAQQKVLCKPRTGPATVGGVEGGFSRVLNLKLFSALLGADTFPRADTTLAVREACRGGKRNLDWFEDAVAGERPYPYEVQLTVVRIGDVTIGTVPGEATTNSGARMRRAMARDSSASFSEIYEKNLVLGLSNGYVHYIATPHEYTAQLYEGAATLYGPYTAEIMATHLGRLARTLPAPGRPSPDLQIKPITITVRRPHPVVPAPQAQLPTLTRTLQSCWQGDTLVARWTDHVPGNLQPARGALLQIERQSSAGSEIVTWDDDPQLEVWYRNRERQSATWEMRYAPVAWQAAAHRVVLRARDGLPRVQGAWMMRGGAPCRRGGAP